MRPRGRGLLLIMLEVVQVGRADPMSTLPTEDKPSREHGLRTEGMAHKAAQTRQLTERLQTISPPAAKPWEACPPWKKLNCLHIATTAVSVSIPVSSSSLIVVGAHHFGADYTDPIYSSVKSVAWSTVLLVEASPTIAAQLKRRVAARNPTPRVPWHKVRAINQGVCPGTAKRSLPFYGLDDGHGLPRWASQAGSFNRTQMDKIVRHISLTSNRTAEQIERLVHTHNVLCTSLLKLLERQGVQEPGLLLIDTEGLDCEILAAQDWSSSEWCTLLPRVIVFEFKHCTEEAYSRAIRALERSGQCMDADGKTKATPYRVVAETQENVFLSRTPRHYWQPARAPKT